MHDHRPVMVAGALRVVGEHHDARQAGNERDGGFDLVLERARFRVGVGRVQQQNRALEHVHDVRRRLVHDHGRREAVRQLAVVVKRADEVAQLVFGGQLPHEQQVGNLLECEPAVQRSLPQEVFDVVAAEREHAFVRTLVAFGKNVAVHVRNVGDAGDDAGTVRVAQPALHSVVLVERRVDGVDFRESVEQIDLVFQRHVPQPLFLTSAKPAAGSSAGGLAR